MRAMRGLAPGEEDDFSINEMDMLTGILDTIFVQVEVGGWFIGLFAILVGCFSIANIMFVSVRERTRIIGIQKAIGARSRFILMQFLFEAVALCVFGALFALAAIGLLVVGINAADLGFELSMHPARVLMALGVAIVSGLIAGVAPARAAARSSSCPARPPCSPGSSSGFRPPADDCWPGSSADAAPARDRSGESRYI